MLIPGISHGFTQFPLLYPPAWKLIDRCARWAVELLSAAETRDQARSQRLLLEQARLASASGYQQAGQREGAQKSRSGDRHHHRRTESSGDEDRPLEMAMTRMRGRTISDEAKKRNDANSPPQPEGGDGTTSTAKNTDPVDEAVAGDADGEEISGKRRMKRGKAQQQPRGRGKVGSTKSNRSIVRLDSSDDLLGRRMQGLAGPLTGMRDDDD